MGLGWGLRFSQPSELPGDANIDGPSTDYIFRASMLLQTECLCPPLQIHMLKPNPQGDVFEGGPFGKWLGHKGGALVNGISALIKEAQDSSFATCVMWGVSKKTDVY